MMSAQIADRQGENRQTDDHQSDVGVEDESQVKPSDGAGP